MARRAGRGARISPNQAFTRAPSHGGAKSRDWCSLTTCLFTQIRRLLRLHRHEQALLKKTSTPLWSDLPQGLAQDGCPVEIRQSIKAAVRIGNAPLVIEMYKGISDVFENLSDLLFRFFGFGNIQ